MRKARVCVRVFTHISAKREGELHENWRELIQDRKSLLSTLDKIAPLMRIGGKMRKRALQSRYTLGSSHMYIKKTDATLRYTEYCTPVFGKIFTTIHTLSKTRLLTTSQEIIVQYKSGLLLFWNCRAILFCIGTLF